MTQSNFNMTQSLTQEIDQHINRAPIRYLPYPHSVYHQVFPVNIYQEMVANLPPTNDYTFSNQSYPERGFIFLGSNRSFQQEYPETYQKLIRSYNNQSTIYCCRSLIWQQVTDWLLSDSTMNLWIKRYWSYIESRFDPQILKAMKFYQRTTLCRDFPGYAIPPHTDTPRKILTIIFYLPTDDNLSQFGTEILIDNLERNKNLVDIHPDKWDSKHQDSWDDFTIHTSAPYKANCAMDFFVCPKSWHGVKPFITNSANDKLQRDTIQVAIYGFTGEPSLG